MPCQEIIILDTALQDKTTDEMDYISKKKIWKCDME